MPDFDYDKICEGCVNKPNFTNCGFRYFIKRTFHSNGGKDSTPYTNALFYYRIKCLGYRKGQVIQV